MYKRQGVVAVIIVIVIFLIIGKVAGWWGGGSKDNSAKKVAEASATPDASSDVSDGDQVEVPSLVGKTLEEAQQLLEDKNLKYKLEAVESDEEANTVVSQSPEADEKVDEYTEVTILSLIHIYRALVLQLRRLVY